MIVSETVWTTIIGAIAGLISGGIASLIAPWVNWGVEKRRRKHRAQRSLIAEWREMIKTINNYNEIHTAFDQPQLGDLLVENGWTSLKQHLSPQAVNHFEGVWNSYCYGRQGQREVKFLMDEVGRIEKEWGMP